MPQQKPWEKYSAPGGGLQPIPVSGPDPYKPRAQENDDRRLDLSATNSARDAARTKLQSAQDLRQEYEKLPEVQAYRTMLSVATKATSTAPGPQGDLSLTYAYSKAMDPTSSVREGEQASVAGTQPGLQAVVEKIKKQFGVDGAGNFTPQARAALRMEIFRAASAMKPLYDRARADMEDHSRAVGVDPKEVIGRDDTATYAPLFRAYGEKEGDDGTISRIIGGEPIKGATIAAPEAKSTGMAGYGATETSEKIPPEMQQEAATYLNQNWGKLDPQAWSDYRAGLDRKYGFNPDPIAYMAEAPKMNDFAVKGGRPDQMGAIIAPKRDMSGIEQTWNNAVANPIGAGVATTANGVGFGIPSLLAGDKFGQLRDAFPKSALAGDIAGGVLGAKGMGGLFNAGAGAVERAGATKLGETLAKPLVADMAYGGAYGANEAAGRGDNALIGGATGTFGAFAGNKLGTSLGKAFPRAVGGVGKDISAIDNSVPPSQELKDLASSVYSGAEAKGLTSTPDETFALNDTLSSLLSKEGRLSPTGRLTEVQPKAAEAYKLAQDYAGEPMTPTQFQTLRGVVADAGMSKDPAERRLGGMMLDAVDNWSDATNPDLAAGLREARGIASRYIQGDKISRLEDLAEPGAGQYTQSGMGNALRTQYRQLDRNITKGNDNFAPNVVSAVQDVARGNPVRNTLRYFGKMAPTGQMGMYGTLGLTGAGYGAAGTAGAAVPTGLALIGTGARAIEGKMAERAARVAELSAYGGQDYTDRITDALARAGVNGGRIGTGVGATSSARLGPMLLALLANQSQ